MKIYDSKDKKLLKSKDYSFTFDKKTGVFHRWGKTIEDDPPYGLPEILDLELSTICHGLGVPCKACYKSSTPKGVNMSLETFKKVFDKLPKTICQIALGIGDIGANPDLWAIMEYAREKGVVPNITINGYGLTDEYAEKLSKLCGAVAVSRYEPPDYCFDAVKKLTDLGMKQINCHQLISRETLDQCYDTLRAVEQDERLVKLNAVVFMMLKPKGDRNSLTPVNYEEYKALISYAVERGISIGGDSCQAGSMYKVFKELGKEEIARRYIESCESFGLFSSYVNVNGDYFPCSFAEKTEGWQKGISVLECNNFLKDIWFSEKLSKYRALSLASLDENKCRKCLLFKEVNLVN